MFRFEQSFARNFIIISLWEGLASFFIILISLRAYIFGNGFFNYADWVWIPSSSPLIVHAVSPSLLVDGSYVNVNTFTTIFVDAPGLILSKISDNPVVSEKIFVIYILFLLLIVSFLLAELVIRIAEKYMLLCLGLFKRELIKTIIVLAIYSNQAIMYSNADGGAWTDSLIILFIAISFLLIISNGRRMFTVLFSAGLMSLSLFLDPDYYLAFVLAVFIAFIFSNVYKLKQRLTLPFVTIMLSFPALFYDIYGWIITASTYAPYPSARNISYYSVSGVHLNIVTSLTLIGYGWSTFSISSPAILFNLKDISHSYFYGNIVLLPLAPLTYFWTFCLILISVLPFVSLAYKEIRGIAIPLVVLLVANLVVSLWFRIPGLNTLMLNMARIPLIGPSIGTTLSVPEHYLLPEGIAETLLISFLMIRQLPNSKADYSRLKSHPFPIVIFTILSAWFFLYAWIVIFDLPSVVVIHIILYFIFSNLVLLLILATTFKLRKTEVRIDYKPSKGRMIRNGLKKVIVILIVFSIIFVGWQAYNGSFFPQRNWGSQSNPHIITIGGYSPANLPDYIVETYSAITSSTSYNSVLLAPNYPEPPVFPYQESLVLEYDWPYINYLIDNGYESFLPYFMKSANIKYLLTYEVPPYQLELLNSSPSLSRINLGAAGYLYSVNSTYGTTYKANMVLNYSDASLSYLLAYKPLNEIGIKPIITSSGPNSLGINSVNHTVNIMSPSYLAGFLSAKPADAPLANFSFPVAMSNTQLNIGTENSTVYLELRGIGFVNNEKIVSSFPKWYDFSAGTLEITGNMTLYGAILFNLPTPSSLLGNYTFLAERFSYEKMLFSSERYYSPHQTDDGMIFYGVAFEKSAKIVVKNVEVLTELFCVISIYIVILLSIPFSIRKRKTD